MYYILGVLIFIVIILVFIKVPYSFVRRDFNKTVSLLSSKVRATDELFTEHDIAGLPTPLQKYFRYCGYIGKKKMNYLKATFKDVVFYQGKNGKKLIIDYTQYNFVETPDRMALISSSLFGIPFEGCDSYVGGSGRMKGVVGKLVPIFNVTGKEMDIACLVTLLADSVMIPNTFLQDYIRWEPIDGHHAKAVISYYGITASGTFTFNDLGEITAFTTKDRAIYSSDGTMSYEKWTITCEHYVENANGIKHPTMIKAIWNLKDGDFTYFDSSNLQVEYF